MPLQPLLRFDQKAQYLGLFDVLVLWFLLLAPCVLRQFYIYPVEAAHTHTHTQKILIKLGLMSNFRILNSNTKLYIYYQI